MVSIRYKAVVPVGVLAVVLAATAVAATMALTQLRDAARSLVERFHEIDEVRQVATQASQLVYPLVDYAASPSEESKTQAQAGLDFIADQIDELRAMAVVNADERNLLDELSGHLGALEALTNQLFDGSTALNVDDRLQLVTSIASQLSLFNARLTTWYGAELHQVNRLGHSAEALPRRFSQIALLIGTVALAVFGFALWLNNRILVRPILTINESTQVLASGHLENKLTVSANDEIGELAGSINRMAQSLSDVYRHLDEQANTDRLTGLMNRRALDNIASAELAASERQNDHLTVAMFDLDHFKLVNDTYGHSIGDVVLKHVANVVSAVLRRSDYLFRYGGEEFVILLRDTRGQGAFASIERCREAIAAAPVVTDGQTIHVTASFGLASYRDHGRDLKTLLENADAALYQAKRSGRNCTVTYQAPPQAAAGV